jgi:murein DD-endopeptidase MepM/ murein hydrolase activator NlpD
MRTPVKRIHFGLTCRVAVLALVAGLGSGCSSGFTRFDSSLYSSAAQPPESQGIDPASTGSIQHSPVPSGDVSAGGASVAQGTYAAPAYSPAAANTSSIQRNSLASPIANAPTYNKAPLLAPSTKPASQSVSQASGVDPVRTASVQAPAAAQPRQQAAPAAKESAAAPVQSAAKTATGDERGWTATGGTTIKIREGETLYNLSKRYGVPVSAILSANGIKDASSVQSGQNIVIPTYVYSRNAPVSAPDSDPAQQSASSGRGQVADQPTRTAAVVPVENQADKTDPRYEPKRRAQPPASDNSTPDYSVTTGSVAGAKSVTVVSGDSLNKIAAKTGVTVAALKAANGLTTDSLKIGQVLSLPQPGQTATVAAKPAATDSTVTGTTPSAASDTPKPYVKPSTTGGTQTASNEPAAPARTGIEEFRWPVRGRVISNFGEKSATGRNDGIDISVPEGTAVKATENGVVVYAGNELEGLGNLVLVRHADGWVSAYAHNKEIDVKRGEEVRRGQVIARSGRTGSADMPKLHFELRKNSTPVDPLKHLGGA